MLKLAEHILETKSGDFDPSQFKDHYEEALVELLRKKQAHIPVKKGKEEFVAPPNVINLMDALRRSVQAGRAAPPAQQKKGRKRIEGQKEMLLPIEGKQAAREAPKKAKPSRPLRAVEDARPLGKRRSSR
jgi:DNA end-binding protein Ku